MDVKSRLIAFDFPVTTGELAVADSASLSMTDTLTIEYWLITDVNTNGGQPNVVNKWHSGGGRSYAFHLQGASNKTRMIVSEVAGGTTTMSRTSSTTINTGERNHLAANASATADTISIFLNGVDDGGTTTGTVVSIYDSTTDVTAGSDGFFNDFDGQIEEIRIWNIARTVDQITEFMFKRIRAPSAELVLYWRMDSALSSSGGAPETDYSNNGNNGTHANTTFSAGLFPIAGGGASG